MSSLRDFHLILGKGVESLRGSSLLPHSSVLQKPSYHFFCKCFFMSGVGLGMAGSWMSVPGPGELGREARGTRCSAIAAHLALSYTSSLGQDGSCLCPHCGQLSSAATLHSIMPSAQEASSGEYGALSSIPVLLALANCSVQDVCFNWLFLVLCLSWSSWVSLHAPGTVCQCLMERKHMSTSQHGALKWGQAQCCIWGPRHQQGKSEMGTLGSDSGEGRFVGLQWLFWLRREFQPGSPCMEEEEEWGHL